MLVNGEDEQEILDLVYLANIQRQRKYWIHPLLLDKVRPSGWFNVMGKLSM